MGKNTVSRLIALMTAAVMLSTVPVYAEGEKIVSASNLSAYSFVKARNSVMYAQSDVEVRNAPSEAGDVIGTIAAGTEVGIGSQCVETGWYSIKYGDFPAAFVSDEFLSASPDGAAAIPDICQIDGDVEEIWREKVNESLSIVPKEVLDAFTADGWVMYVTDKDIDSAFFNGQYGPVMGVLLYDQKKVYIEDRDKAVTTSPVHEIGHFVDRYLGGDSALSDSEEFAKIYEEESNTFVSRLNVQCVMNLKECFAEAVYRYYDNPETMKAYVPKLYNYIETALSTFSENSQE